MQQIILQLKVRIDTREELHPLFISMRTFGYKMN